MEVGQEILILNRHFQYYFNFFYCLLRQNFQILNADILSISKTLYIFIYPCGHHLDQDLKHFCHPIPLSTQQYSTSSAQGSNYSHFYFNGLVIPILENHIEFESCTLQWLPSVIQHNFFENLSTSLQANEFISFYCPVVFHIWKVVALHILQFLFTFSS